MSDHEVWGLTGGIAAGKSSVARIFEEEGFAVLDADRISRELSQPGGRAHAAIVKRFGTAERGELRKLIFANATARADLEAILHPLIQVESLARMQALAAEKRGIDQVAARDGKPRIIYEATLLIETGRVHTLDGLIVVEAPLEARKRRLQARDGTSPAEADRILAAQLSDAERRRAATEVLENSGTLEELRERIRALIARRGWTLRQ